MTQAPIWRTAFKMSKFEEKLLTRYQVQAWTPSKELITHLCGWVDGSYEDKDLQYILQFPWPEKYKSTPKIIYRGEPLRENEAGKLSKDKHKAYGVSWTTDVRKTDLFATDHDAAFGAVYQYQPKPQEVAVNLELFFKDFPDTVSKSQCGNAGELEVILKKNIKLTRHNIHLLKKTGRDGDYEDYKLPKVLTEFLTNA